MLFKTCLQRLVNEAARAKAVARESDRRQTYRHMGYPRRLLSEQVLYSINKFTGITQAGFEWVFRVMTCGYPIDRFVV